MMKNTVHHTAGARIAPIDSLAATACHAMRLSCRHLDSPDRPGRLAGPRRTGDALRYTIEDRWLPAMLAWNQLPPLNRYDAAMKAEGLCTIDPYADP